MIAADVQMESMDRMKTAQPMLLNEALQAGVIQYVNAVCHRALRDNEEFMQTTRTLHDSVISSGELARKIEAVVKSLQETMAGLSRLDIATQFELSTVTSNDEMVRSVSDAAQRLRSIRESRERWWTTKFGRDEEASVEPAWLKPLSNSQPASLEESPRWLDIATMQSLLHGNRPG